MAVASEFTAVLVMKPYDQRNILIPSQKKAIKDGLFLYKKLIRGSWQFA